MNNTLSGKSVPRIGLGCMGMSEFYGDTCDDESLRTLITAYEIGFRHFDTADMYGFGHNEKLLGKFLKTLGNERDNIILTSKFGIVRDINDKYSISVDSSRKYVRTACEASLRRLDTEYIDLYYLHRRSPDVPLEETVDELSKLVEEGKIRSIGICEVNADTLRTVHAIHPIAALQSEYSLWTRDVEKDILPACESLGIPFVAFSPLGRGFLTGKITSESIRDADPQLDFRTKLPRFNGSNIENNLKLIQQLDDVAGSINIKSSQLALAWLLNKSSKINVIPGSKTDKYLMDNFMAKDIKLSHKIMAKLDSIFMPEAIYGDRYPTKILAHSDS